MNFSTSDFLSRPGGVEGKAHGAEWVRQLPHWNVRWVSGSGAGGVSAAAKQKVEGDLRQRWPVQTDPHFWAAS